VTIVRLDPHAHLYDAYSLVDWVAAAIRNLGGGPDAYKMVVIVDRMGQDSFARFRQEAPSFGEWNEVPVGDGSSSESLSGSVSIEAGSLTVIRGVQYVSAERLEVLGLGVTRTIEDGAPCRAVIESITKAQGVPCLPWSPGKWLGRRGAIVARILESSSAAQLVFGDIAIRSRVGPPSSLLRKARRDGYLILPGTDPLPVVKDTCLVGSYGVEVDIPSLPSPASTSPNSILRYFLSNSDRVRVWGRPNSPFRAIQRFIATV
jgi:hypothetical protein